MLRIVNYIELVWRWVEQGIYAIIILLMGALVAVTSYQVFSRYVLNQPLTWSEELSRYMFVWIVFLAAWAAFKEGRHLGMDILSMRLPKLWRLYAGILVDLVVLGFLITVLWIAPAILSVTSLQASAVLKIPMNYVYLAFPAASALMTIEILLGWLNPRRRSPGQMHVTTTELEVATGDLDYTDHHERTPVG